MDVRQDIGDDDIKLAVRSEHPCATRWLLAALLSPPIASQPVGQICSTAKARFEDLDLRDHVTLDIFKRSSNGNRIVVDCQHRLNTQFCEANGQNSRAAPKVETTLCRSREAFHETEAEPSGWMQSSAEGHAGIEVKRYI